MTGLGDIRLYEAIGRMRETADQLQAERDQLKAENAKLRQELEAVGTAAYLYGRDDLKAENAKLRELCEEFARVIKNDDETFRRLREIAKKELNFDFIGSYDESLGELDQLPRFDRRMRELGVEVDA